MRSPTSSLCDKALKCHTRASAHIPRIGGTRRATYKCATRDSIVPTEGQRNRPARAHLCVPRRSWRYPPEEGARHSTPSHATQPVGQDNARETFGRARSVRPTRRPRRSHVDSPRQRHGTPSRRISPVAERRHPACRLITGPQDGVIHVSMSRAGGARCSGCQLPSASPGRIWPQLLRLGPRLGSCEFAPCSEVGECAASR